MRVKRSYKAKNRRKKILKLAKGFRGGRSKLFRTAADAVAKSLSYAYRDRKVKKREFRALWITRINAGVRKEGLSYNQFMYGLKLANVDIDRKMLSNLSISEPDTFKEIVKISQSKLQ